ncbi:MAG: GMC family oxidoreductase N-terminal domain-containing protein [Solirubrobacterales bacterium]|nr:GMC family oxidoreductase N-terminal domain-containing protein [Solirubrobacterales bacterium]
MDAVWERLGVNDRRSDLSGPHLRLKEGCEALGYDFRLITRNTDPETYDPVTAGYLGWGEQSGSKRSTAKTYLADAAGRDADFVTHCRVERILVEGGRATGVEAVYADPEGRTAKVVVRAPQVVVACGSVESPALLLRSGIGGPAVGQNLRLHPTSVIFGLYEESQEAWWGPAQAALSHQFEGLEDGYGFLLECAQHGTGLAAAATPWRSGADHKLQVSRWDRGAGITNRDRRPGTGGHRRCAVARRRVARFARRPSAQPRRRLPQLDRRGRLVIEAAAGQTARRPAWAAGDRRAAHHAIAPSTPPGFSARHQMGTCRMGSDPETSVADGFGQLHDTAGVWIGDASAFPTASGTNPMFTVMSLARRTAAAIAAS